MLITITAIIVVTSILTGHAIRKLDQRTKDLEASLAKVREHLGLSTDDKFDTAVKLIKADRIEEAVELLRKPNKIIGI